MSAAVQYRADVAVAVPDVRHPRRRHRRLAALIALLVLVAAAAAGITALLLRTEPPGRWRETFREDFDQSAPLGQFPGKSYGSYFTTYPDGWSDTLNKGRYAPSKVLSVSDGSLTWNMHTDDGVPLGAAVLPVLATYGQIYGKFELRFRADPAPGFGLAFLLWPDSEKWPRDGEIDFPEGDIGGSIHGYAHHATAATVVDKFDTGVGFSQWHVATIEWLPSGVTFLLDGVVIGSSTAQIPSRSMHWVLQTGTTTSALPAADAHARIQVDWMRAYSYQPDARIHSGPDQSQPAGSR